MFKPILITVALLSCTKMFAHESPFLVSFPNSEIEHKAKISLHHQLIADHQGGVLFYLNPKQQTLLLAHGASIKPGADVLQQLQQARSAIKKNNKTGIPGFPCYATVEETFEQINLLAQNHSDYAELIDIGDSWQKQQKGQGYDLQVLKIGKRNLENPPILFIQSAMHARELATAALTLDFAKMLLNERESNADIKWILDTQQIHILFQTNPDGRKLAETGVSQRKNMNENHCPNGDVGVDLNRNFSFGWGEVDGGSSGAECNLTYRGPNAGSEPEVSAVEQYARSIYSDSRGPNIEDAAPETTSGLYLDIHSYSELILWPWGGSYALAPNHQGLEALGRKLAYFNDYLPMQSVGLYPTDGTSDNLAYGELGIAHITFELGTAFFQSCDVYNETIKPDNLSALLYAAKVTPAPYMLTRGPDVVNFEFAAEGNQYRLNATVSDERISMANGGAQYPITNARYAINSLPTENNSQLVQFKDGNADSVSEQIVIDFEQEAIQAETNTVYVQGQNASGYWGPVSAYEINVMPPNAEGQITCQGAKCDFSVQEPSSSIEYRWQFSTGDTIVGSSGSLILPSMGEYSVELVATNSLAQTATQRIEFSVSELLSPVPSFTATCNELLCQFDANASYDNDSNELAFSWVLGDGQTFIGQAVSHTYSAAGQYEVTLTVSDEHQQSASLSKTINLVKSEPPKDKKSGGSISFWLLGLLIAMRKLSKH